MAKKYTAILCIDKGQSAVKASLYDLAGNEMLIASRDCETLPARQPGWLEQSMDTIWNDTILVVRDLLKRADSQASIAAVSFSGHGGGLFLIDREGKPLCPGMLSMDSRSDEMREVLWRRGELTEEEARAISHVALKLRWIREHQPSIYGDIASMLGAKDWIRYRLTGTLAREVTDPPVPVDAAALTYDTEAFQRLGLEERICCLPPLRYPSDIVGSVTREAAKATGIPEGTPVVAGAHDMMACSAGVGGYAHGHITSILGTMGINVAVVDQRQLTSPIPELRHHVLPGLCIKINNMGSACRTLDWYANLLYRDGELRYSKQNKGRFYDALNQSFRRQEPSGVICLPYLNGEMRGARVSSGFTGISYTTSRDDLMRSVFEGVAFATAERLRVLSDMVGASEYWIVGGGAKSGLICQTVANVIGREVYVAGFSESGCRGGALCAYMALRGKDAHALWEKPKPSHIYLPDGEHSTACLDRFNRFLAFKHNTTI